MAGTTKIINLAEVDTTLQVNLDAEAQARAAADALLQDNIDLEAQTRSTDDGQESTERSSADTSEATARANADTQLQNNIDNEAITRANADSNIQQQIDATNATQNVVDIVGTKAALDAYNTSGLQANDKIQVLVDENEDNANTIYNWNGTAFSLVGKLGPYYTKAETIAGFMPIDAINTLSKLNALVSDATLIDTSDSRLSDARLASDVYSWAKAAAKPSYAFSEITSTPITLAGYGITDAYGLTNANLSSVDWSAKNLTLTENISSSAILFSVSSANTASQALQLQGMLQFIASGYTGQPRMYPVISNMDMGDATNSFQNGFFSGNISAASIVSTVATGTAPFSVNSTTVVTNLNADLWDGHQFSDYLNQHLLTTDNVTFNKLTVGTLVTDVIAYSSTSIGIQNLGGTTVWTLSLDTYNNLVFKDSSGSVAMMLNQNGNLDVRGSVTPNAIFGG
jgi:hypothetical protein